MNDWLNDFDLKSGIDGFWTLFFQGEEVFDIHDDDFKNVSDDDERLITAINLWDAHDDMEPEKQ